MQCPSCGANLNNSESCIECGQPETLASLDNATEPTATVELNTKKSSTLIEFPGVNRNSVPEWRKELSVRVREVQERRAREAAREAAEAERRRAEASSQPPQLELLPQTETPPLNPLVAAALRRIERAHQTPEESLPRARVAAAAVAYAPTLEIHDNLPDVAETTHALETQLTLASTSTREQSFEEPPKVERNHKLIAVPVNEVPVTKTEPPRIAKRLIVDDPNDPALNYLDSIDRSLRVDEISNQRASAFRRLVCSLFDLLTCAVLVSPITLAFYWTGVELTAPGPLGVVAGSAILLTFLYFTLSIALTGRTWAMKLFSLRVIDLRTGLIPTGSQSAGRAFFYLISLAIAGMGVLYALVSREGDAMHDRFTRTAVIKI
jgi:uncharacterized RDD family membrane protein YckC